MSDNALVREKQTQEHHGHIFYIVLSTSMLFCVDAVYASACWSPNCIQKFTNSQLTMTRIQSVAVHRAKLLNLFPLPHPSMFPQATLSSTPRIWLVRAKNCQVFARKERTNTFRGIHGCIPFILSERSFSSSHSLAKRFEFEWSVEKTNPLTTYKRKKGLRSTPACCFFDRYHRYLPANICTYHIYHLAC